MGQTTQIKTHSSIYLCKVLRLAGSGSISPKAHELRTTQNSPDIAGLLRRLFSWRKLLFSHRHYWIQSQHFSTFWFQRLLIHIVIIWDSNRCRHLQLIFHLYHHRRRVVQIVEEVVKFDVLVVRWFWQSLPDWQSLYALLVNCRRCYLRNSCLSSSEAVPWLMELILPRSSCPALTAKLYSMSLTACLASPALNVGSTLPLMYLRLGNFFLSRHRILLLPVPLRHLCLRKKSMRFSVKTNLPNPILLYS